MTRKLHCISKRSMNRKLLSSLVLLAGVFLLQPLGAAGAGLPNILWIVAEDINPQLGCYGDKYADTPNLDRFATGALRYRKCWSVAPVCAPARTTLISMLAETPTAHSAWSVPILYDPLAVEVTNAPPLLPGPVRGVSLFKHQ